MNNKDSDIDLFRCYLVHNDELLLGIKPYSFETSKNLMPQLNTQVHEFGTVVEQLLKNNFNYYLSIMSPISLFSNYGILEELRDLAEKAISKQIYHSTRGMAYSNYLKYVTTKDDVSQKRLNTICRNLQFGIAMLKEGKIRFEPYHDGSVEKIKELIGEIDTLKDVSELPDVASEEIVSEAHKYMLRIRKQYGNW